MTYRKKLIEVALPLEAINKASAYEKMPGIGAHPRGIHLWWARRPLAAARAVIFSQMVDDPSEYVEELLADPAMRKKAEQAYRKQLKAWEERKIFFDKAEIAGIKASANPDPGNKPNLEGVAAALERERLFRIIEELVLWKNSTNEVVLQKARNEILRSWRRTCDQNANNPSSKKLFDPQKLPAFHDPFAGGGALPVEAQRLGLESYASDLNPVAVLINKAMIEIPPKFGGMPPVNPKFRTEQSLMAREWKGAEGLAEDVRYYGNWMNDQAEKRIGHLYPKVEVTAAMVNERPDLKKYLGRELNVIAYLWARTVKSPNPAFANVEVPLAATFLLSTKPGKETYIEPVINRDTYYFTVKVGKISEATKVGTKLVRGNFLCLMSGVPISGDYIKAEGKAGRIGARMMAVVADGDRERVYLSPTDALEAIADQADPEWKPEGSLVEDARAFTPILYGMMKWSDLFTSRQLVALTTLSDLVYEVRNRVKQDGVTSGFPNDDTPLADGGTGLSAYADAIGVYLAFAVDRCADFSNTGTRWIIGNQKVASLFGKQAIAMTWDFSEAGILHETVGGFTPAAAYISKCIMKLPLEGIGYSSQQDAATSILAKNKIVSTDPPYYDNVPYADLSDFFYIWLRRALKSVFPNLFATLAVPKVEELTAFAYRHDGKVGAKKFFLDGMTQAMHRLAEQSHPAFPVTIYYAFKQSESDGIDGTASTGWETFLDAVIHAGFAVTGTWPFRSEQEIRIRSRDSNALASSIVLVCRKQSGDAPTATRREFVVALKTELPIALAHLQAGNIAPVDLAQAAIGPGMAIYTNYAKVLDAQGQQLSVRDALALINETLDEALAEQEGDFDTDTRWALAWFEQSGFAEGDYGVAEILSKAKDTAVSGMVEAGILSSGRGKVRLLKPAELPDDWDPTTDSRLTVWEMVHHLIRVLEEDGESAAAEIVAKLGAQAEVARELCYRLYTLCERKKRNAEALSYNGLVQSWPEITRLAREGFTPTETQPTLL